MFWPSKARISKASGDYQPVGSNRFSIPTEAKITVSGKRISLDSSDVSRFVSKIGRALSGRRKDKKKAVSLDRTADHSIASETPLCVSRSGSNRSHRNPRRSEADVLFDGCSDIELMTPKQKHFGSDSSDQNKETQCSVESLSDTKSDSEIKPSALKKQDSQCSSASNSQNPYRAELDVLFDVRSGIELLAPLQQHTTPSEKSTRYVSPLEREWKKHFARENARLQNESQRADTNSHSTVGHEEQVLERLHGPQPRGSDSSRHRLSKSISLRRKTSKRRSLPRNSRELVFFDDFDQIRERRKFSIFSETFFKTAISYPKAKKNVAITEWTLGMPILSLTVDPMMSKTKLRVKVKRKGLVKKVKRLFSKCKNLIW